MSTGRDIFDDTFEAIGGINTAHSSRVLSADLLFQSSRLDIHNHSELCQSLNLPHTTSNDMLLKHLWSEYGEATVKKLRGAFAFALRDNASGSIFAARDIFGLCPLYYAIESDTFIADESSRALRVRLGKTLELDDTMTADFISGTVLEKELTFFKEIYRLPNANILTLNKDGKTKIEPFWSPQEIEKNVIHPKPVEQFQTLLDNSVKRSWKKGQTAVTVSGGLDSTALIASVHAQKLESQQLNAVTMSYNKTDNWCDGPHIDCVRNSFDLHLLELPSDEHDPLKDMEHWLRVMDGPYLSYGHSVSARLWSTTLNLGHSHMLSGHGGDEIVGYGFGRLNELACEKRWFSVWQNLAALTGKYGGSRLSYFRKYLIHNSYFRRIDSFLQKWTPTPLISLKSDQNFLATDLKDRIDLERYRKITEAQRGYHTERSLHEEATTSAIQVSALEVYAVCDASTGVKTQLPFYDQDLFEFSLSLPAKWKLNRGMARFILRETMAGRIADETRNRKDKFNFAENFIRGLRRKPDRLMSLTDPLQTPALLKFIDKDALEDARCQFENFDKPLPVDLAFFLWRVAILVMWWKICDEPLDRGFSEAPSVTPSKV